MIMLKILFYNYIILFLLIVCCRLYTGRWPDFTQEYLMPVFGVSLFIQDNI